MAKLFILALLAFGQYIKVEFGIVSSLIKDHSGYCARSSTDRITGRKQ